jgi:hypothetical protein
MKLKTWGAKNKIEASTYIHFNSSISKAVKATCTELFGGLVSQLSISHQFWDTSHFTLPWISIAFSVIYLEHIGNLTNKSLTHKPYIAKKDKPTVSLVGFYLMLNIIYTYIIYSGVYV